MKITLTKNATAGTIEIPAGDYWVTLMSDSAMIVLAGAGKDWKIPATRRKVTAKHKSTTVTFYCGGGTTWSIVVSTPKHGEWIAMLEIGKSKAEERRRS